MAARNEQRVLFCGFRRIENIDELFAKPRGMAGASCTCKAGCRA
ncbi:uncharacterized protein LOC142586085 [Dermacentor variabilis]